MHLGEVNGTRPSKPQVKDPDFSLLQSLGSLRTAMRDEEVKIVRYATQLAQAFRAAEGTAVDVTDWLSFFSFDLMGDLAFAKSFDTLETGHWHNSVELVRNGTDFLGIATPVPWLAQILFRIPGVASSWNQMIAWCKSTMDERLKLDVDKADVSCSSSLDKPATNTVSSGLVLVDGSCKARYCERTQSRHGQPVR